MALLDVSELMSDPIFCDPFTVLRNMSAVNEQGINQITQQTIPAYGSVQAASGANLVILPDGSRVDSAIDVYTSLRLMAQGATQSADYVVWKGQNYVVTNVRDWKNFGSGFVVATCTLQALQQSGPP